jgi:hypothetical protein
MSEDIKVYGCLSENQHGIIRHSLLGSSVKGEAYRNYFAAEIGSPDHTTILGLVEAGLMKAGRLVPDGTGLQYFHVTEAGRAAIGAPDALYSQDIVR